ncbi:seven-hairpin glycosidase [Dentipellis sp. KUC8613]|nr:seven-hairpin glycosidase [Dentipellis sp. KUC8613]
MAGVEDITQYAASFFRRPLSRLLALVIAAFTFFFFVLPPLSFPPPPFPPPPPYPHPDDVHVSGSYAYFKDVAHRPGWLHRHGGGRSGGRGKHRGGRKDLWASRADQVRDAFVHAYSAYQEHAARHDELLPLSHGAVNNFNGWGLSVVESLDTMWIMGLDEAFDEGVAFVANVTFSLDADKFAPFFETVIRYLGGLLSAYSLSNDPLLLARADDLGGMMLPAFSTASGLPMFAVNTVNGKTQGGWRPGVTLWAEALSCQMEYKYLAFLTGRKDYYTKVENVMKRMYATNLTATDGLFPTMWNTKSGEPMPSQLSVGAFADSAYEYILKQWLLTGRTETKARDLYIRSANGIISNLLYLTPTRNLLYVTDTSSTDATPSHTFEHLSCFLPGMLALGAATVPLSPVDKERHMWAAEGLAQTCWLTYADSTTGLGPDEVVMQPWLTTSAGKTEQAGRWLTHLAAWEAGGRVGGGGVPPGLRNTAPEQNAERMEYTARKTSYLLRPETVESFYVLWRTTGDPVWRERGWAVFEAIQRSALVSAGYASVTDVYNGAGPKKNEMPSYFLAETLKYLYLLFTDEELIPLDRWVFNTEAHPLPVFSWSPWENERYGISS